MTDSRVFKLPGKVPSPAELASAWTKVVENALEAMRSGSQLPASLAHDPTAPARAFAEFTRQMWTNPVGVLQASQAAAAEWIELWSVAARRAAGSEVEPVIA